MATATAVKQATYGRCVLSAIEVSNPQMFTHNGFMRRLQRKGVPMTGTTELNFHPDYVVKGVQNERTLEIVFQWWHVSDPNCPGKGDIWR